MRPRVRKPGIDVSSLAFASALLSALVCATAEATTRNWNNAAGGAASVSTNWLPAQVPTAVDDLVFSLAGSYPVTFNATVGFSRTHTYKTGTVTLTMSSAHTASTGVTVGDVSGDNATMTLTTGTFTSNAAVVVGDDSGSTGALNVNDNDASFIVGSAADLTVGNNGAASMSITGSGRVEVADQFIVGSNSTSNASATVSGSSVAPISSSLLDVLGAGQSRIGAGGDATMTISSGALASFAGDLVIANGSASTSSVTVQTAGVLLNARLQVDGDLLIGANTSATAAGNGTLNVNTGGTATIGGDTFLGDANGGTGLLHMGGGTFNGTSDVTVLAGSTINGTGTINADVMNSGNIQPLTGTGLTFNRLLTNTTNNIQGTRIHFGAAGGYSGSGTCQADITGDAASTITPTGTLTIGNNSTGGFSFLGTIAVGGQSVTLSDSNGAVLGGLTTIDEGQLSCAAGIGLQLGGAISGEGTLVGNVTSSGIIEPTGNGDAYAELNIQSTYLANPSSELRIELNGPNNSGDPNETDRVIVTGPMTLGGSARLTLDPDYLPTIGEQMILINSQTVNGRTGTIATLIHTPLCDQYTIVLVYSTTAAIALIRPGSDVTSTGDVDRDGDQDLDDFDRWLPCMAGPDVLVPPPGCDPDDFAHRVDLDGPACDDYDVDLADYVVWQRILGS